MTIQKHALENCICADLIRLFPVNFCQFNWTIVDKRKKNGKVLTNLIIRCDDTVSRSNSTLINAKRLIKSLDRFHRPRFRVMHSFLVGIKIIDNFDPPSNLPVGLITQFNLLQIENSRHKTFWAGNKFNWSTKMSSKVYQFRIIALQSCPTIEECGVS